MKKSELKQIIREEIKLNEVHYTASDLNIVYNDIADFVKSEYKKIGSKFGIEKPIQMYGLLRQLFDSAKVSSKVK